MNILTPLWTYSTNALDGAVELYTGCDAWLDSMYLPGVVPLCCLGWVVNKLSQHRKRVYIVSYVFLILGATVMRTLVYNVQSAIKNVFLFTNTDAVKAKGKQAPAPTTTPVSVPPRRTMKKPVDLDIYLNQCNDRIE